MVHDGSRFGLDHVEEFRGREKPRDGVDPVELGPTILAAQDSHLAVTAQQLADRVLTNEAFERGHPWR
jgi:hypothetical protein